MLVSPDYVRTSLFSIHQEKQRQSMKIILILMPSRKAVLFATIFIEAQVSLIVFPNFCYNAMSFAGGH